MFNRIDRLIIEFDKAVRTLAATPVSARPLPGGALAEVQLSDAEKRHAAALMRVNHCGEVCAQALYQGQALSSDDATVTRALAQQGRTDSASNYLLAVIVLQSVGRTVARGAGAGCALIPRSDSI